MRNAHMSVVQSGQKPLVVFPACHMQNSIQPFLCVRRAQVYAGNYKAAVAAAAAAADIWQTCKLIRARHE
jgi:hypothetical protein